MKKLFYSMPDFIVRFWCKLFKCSKIESAEQEVDKEADWDKMVDNLHKSGKQDPDNPNITIINVVEDPEAQRYPKKVDNKTKLIIEIIKECFSDATAQTSFTTASLAQVLITERQYDISKKDISRLLSKFNSKNLLRRMYDFDNDCYRYSATKKILMK